jgi:hypothetical protein
LSFSFRVAGDEWAVGAGGGFGVAEDVNPVVEHRFDHTPCAFRSGMMYQQMCELVGTGGIA